MATVVDDRLDALAERAREMLARSGNCAQSSFAVLQEEFHLDGGQILKALTPFPGIALRGETCGAVVGSLMALGVVFGRDRLDDWAGFKACLPTARHFCQRFEQAHGSTTCGGVLATGLGRKFDLSDRTEAAEYMAAGGAQVCGGVVASAVRMAAEAIMNSRSTTAPSAPGNPGN